MKMLSITMALPAVLFLCACNNEHRVSGASEAETRAGRPNEKMQQVLNELQTFNPQPIETLSPTQARQQSSMAEAAQKWLRDYKGSDAPEPVQRVEDRMYQAGAGSQPVRIYWPTTGSAPYPITLYFHGGGWVLADLNTYDASCRSMANLAHCIIIAPEYRHAPENKFPAAPDDALAAYRWTLNNATALSGDARKIAVMGESAGGNLATVVCLLAAQQGLQKPTHQVLVYPVTDYNFQTTSYRENAAAQPLNTPMMRWFWEQYLPNEQAASDWRAAPLRAPINLLRDTPRATIITAEIDPLKSDGEMYADALKKAGVKVETQNYSGVTHEFFGMGAILPEARRAQKLAAEQLRDSFERAPATTR